MNDTYMDALEWDLALPDDVHTCETYVLYFCAGKPVFAPENDWSQTAVPFEDISDDALFVARNGHGLWYVQSVSPSELPATWQVLELRHLAATDSVVYALASRAIQLLRWASEHRFCGACGCATEGSDKEHVRHCHACGHTYYPKILPCIIVLITRGADVLLARSHRHKQTDQFSLIAGFVEVGETLEQAVHREVFEEVGIRVTNPSYQASQTWPFPGQLMLGFVAEYLEGNIQIQENELAEARWFSIKSLPKVPNKLSIAGWLIRRHVTHQGQDPDLLVTGW